MFTGTQPISIAERSMLNLIRDLLRFLPYDKIVPMCNSVLDWEGNVSDTYKNILSHIKTLPESEIKKTAEELHQWLK